MAINLFSRIAQTIPGLRLKLQQADMLDEPSEFVKKTTITALYMSLGLYFILFVLFAKLEIGLTGLFVTYPIAYVMVFLYFLKLPDVKILKKEKGISREIVFAGRFLIIELESGVPVYETFQNVAKNYETIGRFFREVLDKVNMGTTMDEALTEATELTPSANLRKIFWQILNSMRTGSDVTKSLNAVLDQITREQQIEVAEYGKKLNPLAMFYMMIAVIIPSLGMTMFMVLATFIGIKLSLPVLLVIVGGLGFMQFMFLTIIKSSRPSVDM